MGRLFGIGLAVAALTGAGISAPAHAQAERAIELPIAPPGAALDRAQTLTRIGFGSCNGQDQDQAFWSAIAGLDPQLFLLMGDNVYGDIGWDGGADLGSFRAAYARQAGHPQFADFRAAIPMLATWDDHDFGPNDGGGDFAYKPLSERIFETFWQSGDSVRSRPGVYDSVMIGPEGRRVQIILLDTRFFRSPLAEIPAAERTRPGRFGPNPDPQAQVLGEAQWDWLAQELARPADLRLVVSSIQVLSEAHNFEKWANFPAERARLLEALAARNGGGAVMLTGDRHAAAFYEAALPGTGELIAEFTSSSLNRSNQAPDMSAGEPDPLRTGRLIGAANFGLLDIDWAKREAVMWLLDDTGHQLENARVTF